MVFIWVHRSPYRSNSSFLDILFSPAVNEQTYIPEPTGVAASFCPFHVIECQPALCCPETNVVIRSPSNVKISSFTSDSDGRAYRITVSGLKGFGKFWASVNSVGTKIVGSLLVWTIVVNLDVDDHSPFPNGVTARTLQK